MRGWIGGALGGAVLAAVVFLLPTPSQAQTISTTQSPAGCSSAHCTAKLDDQTYTAPSAPGGSLAYYAENSGNGSGYGLGCSGNLSIVACSLKGDNNQPTIVAFDGARNALLANASVLGPTAAGSAPLVFTDNGILAADNRKLAYFRAPDYLNRNTVTKPLTDTGIPVSPVLVTSNASGGLVFIAEKCPTMSSAPGPDNDPCPVSIFKLASDGTLSLVQSLPLKGSVLYYETQNTPTVDQAHGRVYVEASEICYQAVGHRCPTFLTPRQGRLFAIDVDINPASTTYGQMTISNSWFLNFPGPSGASPQLVTNFTAPNGHTGNALFFDGLAYSGSLTGNTMCSAALDNGAGGPVTLDYDTSHPAYGCFFGVLDSSFSGGSSTAEPMWARSFTGQFFQANAAADPRGGLWIFPIQITGGNGNGPTCGQASQSGTAFPPNCLIRISGSTGGDANGISGYLQGPIDLGLALGKHIDCGDNAGCSGDAGSAGAAGAYAPSSAVMVSTSASNVYLTLGATTNAHGAVPAVLTLDVTSGTTNVGSPSAFSAYWSVPVNDVAAGQFALLRAPDNSLQTVFTGLSYGPAFYGPTQ